MTTSNAADLPALPTGHRWRIRYQETYSWGCTHTSDTELEIAIEVMRTVHHEATRARRWFTVTVTPERDEVKWEKASRSYWEEIKDLSDAGVAKAAAKHYEEWQKSLARDAARASLVGTFPPKSLPTSSGAGTEDANT